MELDKNKYHIFEKKLLEAQQNVSVYTGYFKPCFQTFV